MKRLLIPLLTALALPYGVSANVDPKVAEMCMKAVDFKGCVSSYTRPVEKEVEIETRVYDRKVGNVLFNPMALTAKKVKGDWGRYIKYRYIRNHPAGSSEWRVDADCIDYTADWQGDNRGWRNLKKGHYKEAYKEALDILDEFCPQMDKLVQDAKKNELKGYQSNYFSYPASTAIIGGYSGGGGGLGYQTNFNSINLQNQINSQKFHNNLNNNANRLNQQLNRNQQFNMQQQQNMNNFRMQQNQFKPYNTSPYKF